MGAENLIAVFFGPNNIDIIFTESTQVDAKRGLQTPSKPIPFKGTAVDHEMVTEGIITVSGYAHCNVCGETFDNSQVATTLEKTLWDARYTVDNFYDLAVSEMFFAKRLTLKSYRISKKYNAKQQVLINTVWATRTVTGSAGGPYLEKGGIVV